VNSELFGLGKEEKVVLIIRVKLTQEIEEGLEEYAS